MQAVELLTIVTAITVLAVAIGMKLRSANAGPTAYGIMIAISASVMGALFILVPRIDLIPDGIEGYTFGAVVIVISLMLLIGTWRRLVRR